MSGNDSRNRYYNEELIPFMERTKYQKVLLWDEIAIVVAAIFGNAWDFKFALPTSVLQLELQNGAMEEQPRTLRRGQTINLVTTEKWDQRVENLGRDRNPRQWWSPDTEDVKIERLKFRKQMSLYGIHYTDVQDMGEVNVCGTISIRLGEFCIFFGCEISRYQSNKIKTQFENQRFKKEIVDAVVFESISSSEVLWKDHPSYTEKLFDVTECLCGCKFPCPIPTCTCEACNPKSNFMTGPGK